jgi:hypothetical protein
MTTLALEPEEAPDPPQTFEAPPPATPGAPNPIPRAIPWDEPITSTPPSAAI